MKLTDPCYKLLQQVDEKLTTAVSVTRRLDSGNMRELIRWCQTHELPTTDWVSGSQARFDPAVLAAIDELLQQLGQPGINQVHSGQARLEQAQYGNRENKNHGQPMQGRLLVLQPNSAGASLSVLQQPPADLVLDVPLAQLDIDASTHLLVVENLDMFYQCLELHRSGRQLLPSVLSGALIVYRGHQRDSQSILELIQQFRQQAKPAVYLGDFDAPGICIAWQSGCSHLLLPELAFLQQRACAEHNDPDHYREFQRVLRYSEKLSPDERLHDYLQVLLKDLRALRHQQFAGALQCVSIPI